MHKMSMEAVGGCIFGVDAKCFSEAVSPFVKHAESVFERSLWDTFKFFLGNVPGGLALLKFFKIPSFKGPETAFFVEAIRKIIDLRKDNASRDVNLVDMMIEAMEKSNIEGLKGKPLL